MKRPKPKAKAASPAGIQAPPAPAFETHHLKAVPETFDPIASGERTFDIRLDDRKFKVGDKIIYRRWHKGEAGATMTKTIGYILYGVSENTTVSQYRWGLKAHYVALSLTD